MNPRLCLGRYVRGAAVGLFVVSDTLVVLENRK